MYKFVAIDLDGTLLNSYGQISDKTKDAIKKAISQWRGSSFQEIERQWWHVGGRNKRPMACVRWLYVPAG